MKVLLSVAILLLACEISLASRVLFLFPSPSKSHLIVVQGLSTTLAELGHDVTVVSPFPLSKPMKNYRDIKSPLSDAVQDISSDMVKNSGQSFLKRMPKFLMAIVEMSRLMIEMPEYQKLLKEEKFDLVIAGMFFNNYLYGYGEHFNCPTIMLSVAGTMTQLNIIMGNPIGVSAVPHMLAHQSEPMNFLQRVKHFLMYSFESVVKFGFDYYQKKIYNEFFPADRYRSYEDAVANISMILLNAHFSQGSVRPYVPAMVEVGGLQVKPKPDPLPTDLQKWLDGAKDGAIFFSFGSNAKTTFLPKEKIDILLKVFSQLKQRVVMKWESDTLEGKPDNVLIGKWLPQDDILAHKNIRMFISHCGLGSTVESKYHGVPVVGVPIFADQETNVNIVVSEGWGVKVDLATMTEKSLRDAVQEVLNNPKYSTTVKAISQLYRDRPMNARETAAYWVDYVIRHRGAPHLQYPGKNLNFFQRNSLDVIALLLAVIYGSIKLTAYVFKIIFSKLFKRAPKITKKDDKKKRN